MEWNVAASIADVVSAVAVVVSLIYLSTQIRASTKVNKAASFQAAVDSEMNVAATFAAHAATWNKVVTGAPLAEGAETREALTLYNLFMLDAERRYHQFNAGYLEAQAWEGRLKSLPPVIALPIYAQWRHSLGAMGRGEDFLKLLDDLAVKNSDT